MFCCGLYRALHISKFADNALAVWELAYPGISNQVGPDHKRLAIEQAPEFALAILNMLLPSLFHDLEPLQLNRPVVSSN
jgi:hypothetical protein